MKKAQNPLEDIRRMRRAGMFDLGKSSVEIIREWREKRK